MKIVSKKRLYGVAVFLLTTGVLAGCSNSKVVIKDKFRETPTLTRSNMTDTISCMSSALEKGNPQTAYVFVIRDVTDGTVKTHSAQDGPLSDAGRIQLINVLSSHLYPHAGLVTDTFPAIFRQTSKENVGLNRFGLPSTKNMHAFHQTYGALINQARTAKKLPHATRLVPLIVSGSFTRFDTDNLIQEGSGQNAGSRSKRLADNEEDNIWRRVSGQVDAGKTSSARAISLVMNLVDPRTNLVVASRSFDLIFYRENKTFRLRIGAGDGFYGISRNRVEVEGVHGAQKNLLDAAAFWLLDKAYGGNTNFSSCFSDEQQVLRDSYTAPTAQRRAE